jgi:hypothetical protein
MIDRIISLIAGSFIGFLVGWRRRGHQLDSDLMQHRLDAMRRLSVSGHGS